MLFAINFGIEKKALISTDHAENDLPIAIQMISLSQDIVSNVVIKNTFMKILKQGKSGTNGN